MKNNSPLGSEVSHAPWNEIEPDVCECVNPIINERTLSTGETIPECGYCGKQII